MRLHVLQETAKPTTVVVVSMAVASSNLSVKDGQCVFEQLGFHEVMCSLVAFDLFLALPRTRASWAACSLISMGAGASPSAEPAVTVP